MICRSCGANSHHIRTFVDGNELIDYCESKACGNFSGDEAGLPDVYWPGHSYRSEALDIEFTSRSQKAKYLKDNHLSEAGDVKFKGNNWIEGSRSYRKKQFEKNDKERIRNVYQEWVRRNRA